MTRQRGWLLLPAAVLYAADVALTLAGQPAAYWAGDHAAAVEANPLARLLLVRGPWAFVAGAAGWAALLGIVVACWRHPWAVAIPVAVAFLHAVGGGTWLVHLGPLGPILAVGYLAAAAQACWWCWDRGRRADAVHDH